MRGLVLSFAVLLGACAFDASGQEMAEVDGPDAGGTVIDDVDAGVIDAAPTEEPPPPPPPPDAEPEWDDDHEGPGGGHGPGHGGGD